jgi:GTP-binding protein
VDLPGYGFAKVSRAEQEKWGPMIETYLSERESLRLVVSILDVRHDPTQQDRDLIEWLRHYGRRHLIVLTKTDKLSRGEALRRRRQIAVSLGLGADDTPILFSAQTGEGKGDIWNAIIRVLRTGDESVPGSG